MTEGRHVWAGLQLLDRQLVDHDGLAAGCVDDIELAEFGDGDQLYAAEIRSGPGVLAYRLHRRRFGRWLTRAHRQTSPGDDDATRIPFNDVSDIGASIKIGRAVEEVGSQLTERWVRDHIIDHVPGSGHAPE
jgi:hypothetical protein